MTPSDPGYTSIKRAILFSFRRTDSSISDTKFPTFSTRSSSVAHLDLTFHSGRYSFAHLLQIIWFYAWDTLYILRQSTYLTASRIKGSAITGRPNREWFGVNASRSSRLSLTGVNGLAFNVCSTKHIVVVSSDNVSCRFPRIANIAFLQLRTSLSQIPPKCGAPGGLNFLMSWPPARRSHIASRSHSLKHSLNSRAAPTKFVPLSLMIVCGFPRLAMNLVIAIMHASVSSPFTTSMWTALVTKHVNRQHRYLTGLRRTVIPNEPKYSIPALLNGYTLPFTRSLGMSTMWGRIGCTPSFLHLTHLDLMLRCAFRNPITQNLCWTRLPTYSVPSWWLSSCICLNIRTTAGSLAESRIGCFAS